MSRRGRPPETVAIFPTILANLKADPAGPLDIEGLPDPELGDGLFGVPGFVDGCVRFEAGDGVEQVVDALAGFAKGALTERDLELRLHGVRALAAVDRVLRSVVEAKMLDEVADALWRIARTSDDYEAVKWGIAIGSRSSRDVDAVVDDLLVFARHSEFTLYATNALLWHAGRRPDVAARLVRSLSLADMWGRYHMLSQFGVRRELFHDHDVQCELVARAGETTLDGRGELALARLVDMPLVMERAADAPDLAEAVMGTMDGLMQGAATSPLDLDDAAGVLSAYLDMLERLGRSARRLDALATLDEYLRRATARCAERQDPRAGALAELGDRAARLTCRLADDQLLIDMIGDRRWLRSACQIASRHAKPAVIPALQQLIVPEPDDAGRLVPGYVISALMALQGSGAIPTLERLGEVFADERVQGVNASTYACWAVAMLEAGSDEQARAAARALHSPSRLVRWLVCDGLRRTPASGSDIVRGALEEAFERTRSAASAAGGADPGDVGLVIELGDESMHEWLFLHVEQVLPQRDPSIDRPGGEPRFCMHRDIIVLAADSNSNAARTALRAARTGPDERIRACVNRLLSDRAHPQPEPG